MSTAELIAAPVAWDAFTRWVSTMEKLIDEMPDRRCESAILAAMNGTHLPPCQTLATVSDVETEFQFCPDCYRKFKSGHFYGWR